MTALHRSGELLFHCFPSAFGRLTTRVNGLTERRTSRYRDCGLAILESILRNGMLLTPERIKIARHPGAEQACQPPIEVGQTRASFTLASLEDLKAPNPYSPNERSHFDTFGWFSIGLDPVAARDFDMAPVFYYYTDATRSSQTDRHNDDFPLIASLVHAMTEAREILSVLAMLERRSIGEGNENDQSLDREEPDFSKAQVDILFQPFSRADRIRRVIRELPSDLISRVLAALDTDRRPFWNMVEAIDLLMGLMQSADSSSLGSQLLYYSQREWRLTRVLNKTVVGYELVDPPSSESPQREETREAMLRSVHEVAQLMDRQVDEDWLRNCWVLLGSARSGKFFREYIRTIACPKPWHRLAENLSKRYLGTSGVVPEIVAL